SVRGAGAGPRRGDDADHRRGGAQAGADPVRPAGRGTQRSDRGGDRVKLGNLIIAGIVTGSIYATFAVCVAIWYRVSNILNLAVGDFAMVGALSVDNLYRVRGLPLWAAIACTLAEVAVFALLYDLIVLRLATERPRTEGIVLTFFFTFALSF